MAGVIPQNVEWLDSQKDLPLLSVDGYLFSNSGKRKTAAVQYWKCKTSGCSVTAKTMWRNLITLTGVTNPPRHGHVDNSARIETVTFTVSNIGLMNILL